MPSHNSTVELNSLLDFRYSGNGPESKLLQ